MRRRLVVAMLLLLAPGARAADSRLRWAGLLDPKPAPEVLRYGNRVIELARAQAGHSFLAREAILSEGKLPTDPGVAESRLATSAELRAQCREAAAQGLSAWARTYKPTGNPINENQLVPLVEARALDGFGRALAAGGDAFYAGLKPGDGRIDNNWGTWRLCLRALIAQTLGDAEMVSETRELVSKHIAVNLRSDGSSIDFRDRDALHYHVYDLEAFATMAALMPAGFLSENDRAAIVRALEFLRPYVAGEKTHVEFVGSKVPFDIKRRKSGLADYQNAPWKPQGARPLLRLARAVFPEIRPWTGAVVDESYDPMLKLQAAALGDRP